MDVLKAMSPYNQPHHAGGLLRVSQGQFTFDNEGLDYSTTTVPFRETPTLWFSRVLHWPGGNSGVTLGRGFDMKLRSTGEIHSMLRQAGLEEHKAVICSRAAGLRGRAAQQFVTVFGPMVGEITHQQQIQLFEIVYPRYLSLAKGYYIKYTQKLQIIPDAISWEAMDQKIKEVYIVIVYQGVNEITSLVKAVAGNDKNEFKKLIKNTPRYMRFERKRKRMDYL